MSKKKKNDKSTDASTDASTDKPKKVRKPRDPNAVKLPWNERQLVRLAKIGKRTAGLRTIMAKAKDADVNALLDRVMADLTSLHGWLNSDAAKAYKPVVRAQKVAIGAVISIKTDAETLSAKVFTAVNPATGKPYLDPALFDKATVIDDERTAWFVQCADGQTRLIGKKLVQLAS